MIQAEITNVQIGHVVIEGLLVEDGSFAVSTQQTASLFQVPQNNAQRTFKALLGEGNRFLKIRVKNAQARKEENCLTLSDFERVLIELAIKGNAQASAMLRSLAGLSIHQLFADAFGLKFEAEDRQAWLKNRQDGKDIRNTFTDSVAIQYLDSHPEVDKVPFYAFSNPSDLLNRLLTGHPAKYWREKFQVESDDLLRDVWGSGHLNRISNVEDLAQAKIENEGMNPCDAIKSAVEAFHYSVWDEEKLLGKDDRRTYLRNKQRESRARRRKQA